MCPPAPASPRSRSGSSGTGTRTAPSRRRWPTVDTGENGDNEFVFYDGPPFANGLPHYGHLLTGYVKDVVPRYETMRGRRVERRFGWDTHGLPAELEAMSQLGIKTKEEILELGIEDFNAKCRELGAEVHGGVARVRHPPGALGRLRQRLQDAQPDRTWSRCSGRSRRSTTRAWSTRASACLPYCWNDQTPLTNHELRMDDDVYKNRQDPAVTVGLPPRDRRAGPDLDDHPVDPADATSRWRSPRHRLRRRRVGLHRAHRALPLAEARLAAYARELGEDAAERVVERLKGCRPRRAPLHPAVLLLRGPRRSRTSSSPADYVTTEDGTGIVHIAAAFGEEDKQLTDQYGHRARRARRPRRPLHLPGHRLRGPARLRRQPAHHRAPQGGDRAGEGDHGVGHRGHGAAAARDLRPLLPALLALPRAADLHGGVVAGSSR